MFKEVIIFGGWRASKIKNSLSPVDGVVIVPERLGKTVPGSAAFASTGAGDSKVSGADSALFRSIAKHRN